MSGQASEDQLREEARESAHASETRPQRTPWVPWIVVLLAMLATGVAMVGAWPRMNHDVAAIGLIAERMLEGEALYVDIPEVNPPLVFLLSGLVVRVAGWTGVPWPTLLVIAAWAWVAAGSLLVGWVCARGRLLGTPRARAALTLAVFAVHASLVGGDFAQREALFVAAWLPLVCSGAAAARGVELPVAGSVALAVFAALGIAFKPFFAPIWIAAELVFALHAGRRALLMRRENVTLGGLLMGYGLYVVYLTPYLDHLGEWVGPYSAYDLPLAVLLWRSSPAFLVAVVVAGAIWRLPLARDSVAPLDLAMLAATLPAMASVLVQAKGFSYHAWPLNALVALVLVLLVLGREPREATLRRPSFSTLLGVSGLLLLLLSSVVGRFPLLQPAAFAMTALAFLAGPGAEGDSPGAVTAKPPAGSRQPATHWAAPSTWVLVASLLTLGASRAALSWIPSVRATFDEYTCQSIPYAQSRQTCSYAALLSALRPHVAPGDGVLWVTSDSIPASLVMMELGLRAVARETFMRVPHAYARRNDPRIRYPYHSPEQALGDEQQVRDSFVSSVVASMPKLVIFDRRADAIAFGAVPFDAEAWFRADPAGAACLDASYVPLDIGAATRGTHVAYVRRD